MRYSDTILNNRGYAQYEPAPMIDLKYGGQFGPMAEYGGYISSSAYVSRPLIAVLLAPPLGLNDLDSPDLLIRTLKSLVEKQSKTIEGLNATLTVSFQQNPFGGAGEQQEDFSNVERQASTPTHTWTERQGKPINRFLTTWITGLMMDPATKYPWVISRTGNTTSDLLPDYTGMTVLYFEPDPVHKKVVEAWLCTNMHPKGAGEVTANRDLPSGGQTKDYNIEFTAISQYGYGVKRLAQNILNTFNLGGMNPNLQQAHYSDISADVKAADTGYKDLLTKVNNTKIS